MFSYFTVVYGLKQNQRFHECIEISRLLSCHNCIVYEHITENEDICGWPGLHYHGLFEIIAKIGFKNDRIINQIKTLCSYFTTEDLKDPLDYLRMVNKYEMQSVFKKICVPSELDNHIEKYNTIQNAVTISSICRPCHSRIRTKFHEPILSICRVFKVSPENDYLTPDDSARFVHNWCITQNILTKDFINDLIYCLDGELENKNSLYFQGVNNTCIKSILDSIARACEPYVEKVDKGTTGYKYFWKCCLGKRLVFLYDPYFDGQHSKETMLEILEGTESTVLVDGDTPASMQRTPVVIIAHEYPNNRKVEYEIKNRLVKCYRQLKNFQPPEKKLHPMWLCLLAERYYIPYIDSNIPIPLRAIRNEKSIEQDNSKVTFAPEIPPAKLGNGMDTLMQEYRRISDVCPQVSEDESDSDVNGSELSEDNSEYGIINTEEKIKKVPLNYAKGSNFVNKEIQDSRSEGEHSALRVTLNEGNKSLSPGLFQLGQPSQGIDSPGPSNIKDQEKASEGEYQALRGQKREAPVMLGLNLSSPGADVQTGSSNLGPSNAKIRKKESTKGSVEGDATLKAHTFQPVLTTGLQQLQGMNSPGPSNVKVNEKIEAKKKTRRVVHNKETGEKVTRHEGNPSPQVTQMTNQENGPGSFKENRVQGGMRDEQLTAKQKIMKKWKTEQKNPKHPQKELKCTFKNLMK